MQLTGLHHVTAVTANAAENLRFYTEILGLRLVKKTVNQDDVSAYHLFYGDEKGSPGTEVTFFDWSFAAPRRHGTGTISEIGLRVPDAKALGWWRSRFEVYKVEHLDVIERGGRMCLPFSDNEGQRLNLVAEEGQAKIEGGTPWAESTVPAEVAIRGLNHVTLTVNRLEPTARELIGVLGFQQQNSYTISDDDINREIFVFTTGEGGPGTEVHVDVRPDLPRGNVGRGGVHHVAFRTPDDEHHQQWQLQLQRAGVEVTPVIDRFYFRSLYFREPGGVLFEIATDGPGFATDESFEHLGEELALPPFLEPHRARIEAKLKPLPSFKTKTTRSE
jgi:glyoxalase family protein